MRIGIRDERGVTLVATAIWIFALVGIAAIAVEVARLTDTATEVQIAADSAALAAALAMTQGQDEQTWGKNAAAANSADGRAVDRDVVQIDIGRFNSDPAVNPHFTEGCTRNVDCNAARATVTVSDVRYIMASILSGQTATSVQKKAVATIKCPGSAFPFPMAVCDEALLSIPGDHTCFEGPLPSPFNMSPTFSQNACWTSLGPDPANTSTFLGFFPKQCGGTPPETFLGENINLQNGEVTPVWKALQCCVQCQKVKDFTVPVIDCPPLPAVPRCNNDLAPVIGFATIHIESGADIDPSGGGVNHCSCGNINNDPKIEGIKASQTCNDDVGGAPGPTDCTNFGTTVAPVLGQLP